MVAMQFSTSRRILWIDRSRLRDVFIEGKDEGSAPVILTTSFGRLFGPVGTFSIFLRTSRPSESSTLPKTTCFPSRKSAGWQVMKNYEHSFLGHQSRVRGWGLH